MNIKNLKPGMYVIDEDVWNPEGDRRRSKMDFHSLPIWVRGTRVAVTDGLWGELRIHPADGYAHLGVAGRPGCDGTHRGFEVLVAALRPVEQTHLEWVQVNVNCPDRVLVKLLETKKITRQDVLKAKKS